MHYVYQYVMTFKKNSKRIIILEFGLELSGTLLLINSINFGNSKRELLADGEGGRLRVVAVGEQVPSHSEHVPALLHVSQEEDEVLGRPL